MVHMTIEGVRKGWDIECVPEADAVPWVNVDIKGANTGDKKVCVLGLNLFIQLLEQFNSR